MESSCTSLILRTLPPNLKAVGSKLIEASRATEEERRLKGRSHKYRKHHDGLRNNNNGEEQDEEQIAKRKMKAEKAAQPLAIARLVMELWSPRMRRHAENVILKRAVEERYLRDDHLKWVHAVEEEECGDSGWLVEDVDDLIVELIWNKFNLEKHFQQVAEHRKWVQRSYDRLKDFMPSLPPKIVERHDLSKFAFSQAIGYTLKWTHNTHHDIWSKACDLHLHSEPHHPKMWSTQYTPQEKHQKMTRWMRDVCDFHDGHPYGMDVVNLDLESEDFPKPFLLESFVDMVGVEWERKKGKNLDISTRELVYMDDKFLARYTRRQHWTIKDLMDEIIASDDTLDKVVLTERERMLMTTVPRLRRSTFVFQIEVQKKIEEKRLIGSALTAKGENGAADVLTNRAHDTAYLIMVSRAVTELWGRPLRQQAQNVILQQAIKDKFITQDQLKWVLVFNSLPEDAESQSERDLPDGPTNDDFLLRLLWVDFNIREHFSQVHSHRQWVRQSYRRLSRFMPELSEEVIERHDLSKFGLLQCVGYTLKWVHNINHSIWRKSCDLHLNHEPHHTQMWSNRHAVDFKQSCLDSWLSAKDGAEVLDLTSENMARAFLQESLVDMVAIEWQKNKEGKPDLTYSQLIYMEDRYLSQYSHHDKLYLQNLMSVISDADQNITVIT
ncbi:uncharacterized protein LOC121867748 [Homarus americanus]|uniref:Uncharacterized protein n=1 Tax=Homarus americanus TaxID=6706 RepID=A0A8J5K6J4_HOMAM|nr:uncharacterized protein LOC121867748 [Homarus americanus]KAG7167980.1 hypothetical protein Hamer_G018410 [Homarus americanus]